MRLDYKKAGVNINAGEAMIPHYKEAAKKTTIPGVMGSLGGFASLFSLKDYPMEEPILVSGTDGVGTKLILANQANMHDTIGIDLVAMCINDIITCGAKPLFFLDYFGTGKLNPEVAKKVVGGIADGCLAGECALVGGETAEMPGMYPPGDYDLAGFAVGVIDKKDIIDGSTIEPDQTVIALPSSGLHSNGYSLARKVLEVKNIDGSQEFEDGKSLYELLLKPTTLYTKVIRNLINSLPIKGIANITGGGIIGNANRVLPNNIDISINKGDIRIPKIFSFLQDEGNIKTEEMFRAFNMGVGMVIIVKNKAVEKALAVIKDNGINGYKLGKTISGLGKVILN